MADGFRFPPDAAEYPSQAKGWAAAVEAAGDGWRPVEQLWRAYQEASGLSEGSARRIITNARKHGWARFRKEGDDWLVRIEADACGSCGSPRSLQDALEPAEAADDTEAAGFARLREAVGRDGWLNAMAIAGIVAALGPIEPEELAVAVREFKTMSDAEMGSAMELLTDRLSLVELSTKLDPKLIFYVMAD